MIHLSGAFAYQRPAVVESRPGWPESQPPAFYLSMLLRNDDGTPVFPDDSNIGEIAAVVVLSRPQQLVGLTGFTGYLLHLTLDFIQFGYLGFTARLDDSYGTPPASWLPLGILIFVGELTVGILTAAPYPLADSGVAPPLPGWPGGTTKQGVDER